MISASIGLAATGFANAQGISPACEQMAANNPPGEYEVDPPNEGFVQVWSVSHEYGWLGAFTVTPTPKTYSLAHVIADANRTCETSELSGSFSVSWTDSWNVSGTVGGSATAEAKAGVVLAQASASATVHASITGGLTGSKTYEQQMSYSSPLPHCTAKIHKTYLEHEGASASAPYADLIITTTCVFGDCAGESWQMNCGETTFVADVLGEMISTDPDDYGWSSLPPPNNCDECDEEEGEEGEGGEGEEGEEGGESPWWGGGDLPGPCPAPPFFDYLDPYTMPEVEITRIATTALVDLYNPDLQNPEEECPEFDFIIAGDTPIKFVYAVSVGE